MSVIGDALGRAERDYRTGELHNAVAPSRAADPKPQYTDEASETAVKGIARPRQVSGAGGAFLSNALMTLFVTVIGFAGYLTVFPDWIDSLWKFPDLAPHGLAAPSNASLAEQENSPNQQVVAAKSAVATANANEVTTPLGPTPAALPAAEPTADIETSCPLLSVIPEIDPHKISEINSATAINHATVVPNESISIHENRMAERSIEKPTVRNKPKPIARKRNLRKGRRVSNRSIQRPKTRSITRVPVRSNDISSRFSVDGVMLGGERKLAVINGSIVGVDEEIDGAVVRAITGNGVAIEIGGRIRRLPIHAKHDTGSIDSPADGSMPMDDFEFND